MRTCYTGEVSLDRLDAVVTLFGWVHRRRDHGGVIFIDLRDRAGLAQVVCDPDRAEMFKVAENVRNEFCVRITGLVRRRPDPHDKRRVFVELTDDAVCRLDRFLSSRTIETTESDPPVRRRA